MEMMSEQQKLREELVRKEIQKICSKNPDILPVYYILTSNQPNPQSSEEWPLLFFNKRLTLSEVIDKLKQKFKTYPFIYIFGKDSRSERRVAEMSLKQKRKNKGKVDPVENRQKLVCLDEELKSSSLGETHQRFRDNNNLLVMILSKQPLQTHKQPKRQIKQYVFIAFCIICVVFYLYLCTTNPTPTAAESSTAAQI